MNILITDDEPLIHISIEKLINACTPELHVFHAYNGHEMLQQLTQHKFFLAFVDIKMPGLSGLETIQQALEISPMTRYYIMSGFDEFEYAKQAIKLKVDDYLLKPLDQKTIHETILAAQKVSQAHARSRKTVFRNWLESSLNHRQSSLEQYSNYYCSLLLITVDHPDFPKDSILQKLFPYNDNFVSVFSGNQLFLLCFSEESNLLRDIRQQLSGQSYNKGITLFASSVTCRTEELNHMLSQLETYSSLRVLLGIERFYFLKPLLEYNTELLEFCEHCLKWQAAFYNKIYTEFMNQSEFICKQLESQTVLKNYNDKICFFLSSSLNTLRLLPTDPAELKDQLYHYGKTLLQSPDDNELVQSIIHFIKTHYCDDISISYLSQHFGLSANYISTLIKQKLGIRYNDYLTQLRLNYAKELLLSTNKSVKDITAACGYYSQSHFTKLFIEHENCTPTEYRKQNTLN